jgi:photosystem II stability/assembly factor-like uncharacterized protein
MRKKGRRKRGMVGVFLGLMGVLVFFCLGAPSGYAFAKLGDGAGWELVGPGGAQFMPTVVIHPEDSDVIYVGTNLGGVRKSVDNGNTWATVNHGFRYDDEQAPPGRADDIETLAISPNQPETVFAGIRYGGIYKTTNGGETWERKLASRFSIGCFAFDPRDPNIIYAGTGHLKGDRPAPNAGDGSLYKSSDHGESWARINGKGVFTQISAIVVHPRDSRILFINTDKGVFKSSDGGANWVEWNGSGEKRLPNLLGESYPSGRRLVIDPTNPDVMYATVHNLPKIFKRSKKDNVAGGKKNKLGRGKKRELQEAWAGGVFKTVDGGKTWEQKARGLKVLVTAKRRGLTNFTPLRMDPKNPQVLYVGDVSKITGGLYRSIDAGETWARLTITGSESWDTGGRKPNMDHGWLRLDRFEKEGKGRHNSGIQVTDISISRDSKRVYFSGLNGIIYRTDNATQEPERIRWHQVYTKQVPPGSGLWQTTGMALAMTPAIAIDPSDSRHILFGQGDHGIWESRDGGKTWMRAQFGGGVGDPNGIYFDPQDSSVIYITTGYPWKNSEATNAFRRVGNAPFELIGGGKNNQGTNQLPGGSRIHALVIDPREPKNLYAIRSGDGVYKNSDKGKGSWRKISQTYSLTRASAMAMSSVNSRVLYVATEGGEVFKGVETGKIWTWHRLANLDQLVWALQAHPSNNSILFAATSQGVVRSQDGGKTWSQKIRLKETTKLLLNPQNPDVLYAASRYHGIWRSVDGGDTWHDVNSPYLSKDIVALALDPKNPDLVYISMTESGVWRRDFGGTR